VATPDKSLIQQGKTCPYCFAATEFVASAEVYGRDYGMIYLCRPCDAWVGVHNGTNIAKGRLANAELREWKIRAHFSFDKIWNHHLESGMPKHVARNKAYDWIAEQMHIDRKDTHIGMFDVKECKQVILLCDAYQFQVTETLQTSKPTVNITLRNISEEYERDVYIPSQQLLQETAKEAMLKWCSNKNVSAIEIQAYQIRFFTVNKKIDVFPQSRKYHDITENKRGSYRNLINFLDTQFCD